MKKAFRKLRTEELLRKSSHDYKNSIKNRIVLVLDNVRSANNVGSIFRTSDAFLVDCIYLCGITATPPNPEIHKTALGAELSVPWKYNKSIEDTLTELRDNNYEIIAIEQAEGSVYLQDFNQNSEKKYALILGNEVHGVSESAVDFCDSCIEIPQFGTKHSFNVSVTCGIALWELVGRK